MVLKHIVMWKLKDNDDSTSEQTGARREAALRIKAELEGLRAKIPEIRMLEVGINIDSSPAAYDVVLNSEFADEKGLAAYQNHPEHIKAGRFINSVRENRIAVDYWVD